MVRVNIRVALIAVMLIILATLVRSAAFQVVAAGSVTLIVTTANPVVNQPVSFSGTDSVNPNGPVIVFDYNTPDCTHPAIDDQGPMTISGGVFSATFPGTDFPTAGTYSAVAKDVSVAPSVVSSCVAFTVTAGPPPASSATDWAVLSVSLSPPNPNVGDLVTFSMVVTALSSQGSFPQNFAAACQIDGVSCGGGSLTYPGSLGTPMTVSTQTPWIATAGTHTWVWGVATIPVGQDPNKSNNAMSKTFTVSPKAPFDYSISATPTQQNVAPGGSVSFSVTVNPVSGTPQSVALSLSGMPTGVSGTFNPTSGTPPYTSMLSVTTTSTAAPGTVTLTITGSCAGVTHTVQVALIISQVSDFSLDVTPPSQSVLQGQVASYAIHVHGLNGFNSQVALTVNGAPSGINSVFSVPSGTPDFDSTLTVTTPATAPTGPVTLTVTATGGGQSHQVNLVLIINPATPTSTSSSATTENSSTQQSASGDLTGFIQQNPLLIALGAVIALLVAALVVRNRKKPTQATTGTRYCSTCGTPNPSTNEFCGKCGKKLT